MSTPVIDQQTADYLKLYLAGPAKAMMIKIAIFYLACEGFQLAISYIPKWIDKRRANANYEYERKML